MINVGTLCWSKGDVVKVTVRRAAVLCLLLILGIGVMEVSAEEFLAQSMQTSQQDEFVPIDELEAEDQLPAAPLLVAVAGLHPPAPDPAPLRSLRMNVDIV